MARTILADWIEFRPDDRGKFDELVAKFADGMVHMETLDDDRCYIGFYWDDGRHCQLWFGAKKKKLWFNHEHGISDPPRFTAQGVDRKPWMNASGIVAAKAGETRQGLDERSEQSPTGEAGDAQSDRVQP